MDDASVSASKSFNVARTSEKVISKNGDSSLDDCQSVLETYGLVIQDTEEKG